MKRLALALFLVVAPALHGQEAKLSDTEQLRLDLLRTQVALEQALSQSASCRAQLRSVQLSADEVKLTTDIGKAHDGFDFDVNTGQLTRRQPKPDAATGAAQPADGRADVPR